MNNSYTEDFADIMSCYRERKIATEIMVSWDTHGLPEDFDDTGVKFGFNRNSGHVFLVNSDYQCAMLNSAEELELWLTSPYEGREGFLDELIEEFLTSPDSWHEDDVEWLQDMAPSLEWYDADASEEVNDANKEIYEHELTEPAFGDYINAADYHADFGKWALTMRELKDNLHDAKK